MATFKKRGSSWQAQVRRKGHKAEVMTFRLKTDAERWARGIEADMEREVHFPSKAAETTTFAECIERYKVDVTPTKKSAVSERSVLNKLLLTPLAPMTMAAIGTEHITAYKQARLKEGLGNSTVLRAMMTISHIFTVARKEWSMKTLVNPVLDARKPRVADARDRRVLKALMSLDGQPPELVDELTAISAHTDSKQMPAIARLAVETAMRRSEIMALTWDRVRLDKRTAKIADSKNGEGRTVPLTTAAVKNLQEVPRRKGDNRIFNMSLDAVSRAFSRARDRARRSYLAEEREADDFERKHFLVGLRFHDLRHEAASTLVKYIPGLEIAKVTGHKDVRMVMRYINPDAEAQALRLP